MDLQTILPKAPISLDFIILKPTTLFSLYS
nr:MAG TPA: hypothetical protein [Caudoviricetes sp.]